MPKNTSMRLKNRYSRSRRHSEPISFRCKLVIFFKILLKLSISIRLIKEVVGTDTRVIQFLDFDNRVLISSWNVTHTPLYRHMIILCK